MVNLPNQVPLLNRRSRSEEGLKTTTEDGTSVVQILDTVPRWVLDVYFKELLLLSFSVIFWGCFLNRWGFGESAAKNV